MSQSSRPIRDRAWPMAAIAAAAALAAYTAQDGTAWPVAAAVGALLGLLALTSQQRTAEPGDQSAMPVAQPAHMDPPEAAVAVAASVAHDTERELLLQNSLLQNASMALFDAKVSAEDANRRKTQFLTYASHEIRTPLTAILGFAEQLQDKSLTVAEREEAARIIRRNSEHLLTVLSDVLDLAKIEADHLEVCYSACDVRGTVKDVVALFALSVQERGGNLTVDEITALPASVSTDTTRLRQILINLLSNALRQPSGSAPSPGVSLRLRLSARAEPPQVSIELCDRNSNLSPIDLERLFEPFEKAMRCAEPGPTGTLGMAISRRLARLLGGDVTARTELEGGTTFALTFNPGALEPETQWTRCATTRTPKTDGEAPLRAHVLLAEDGTDNQRLISTILRRAGAEVTIVNDGARALEAVDVAARAGRAFDAIIMDMQMPVMDGYEATTCLRTRGYLQPILALTANAFADARQRCLDAGCDDYASKPIDRRTLLTTLRGLLQRGSLRRQAVTASTA